jgi:hypothetical protein
MPPTGAGATSNAAWRGIFRQSASRRSTSDGDVALALVMPSASNKGIAITLFNKDS